MYNHLINTLNVVLYITLGEITSEVCKNNFIYTLSMFLFLANGIYFVHHTLWQSSNTCKNHFMYTLYIFWYIGYILYILLGDKTPIFCKNHFMYTLYIFWYIGYILYILLGDKTPIFCKNHFIYTINMTHLVTRFQHCVRIISKNRHSNEQWRYQRDTQIIKEIRALNTWMELNWIARRYV